MIRFSTRVPTVSGENPLLALLHQEKSRGEEICDLTVSNPTKVGLPYPEKKIAEALRSVDFMHTDPSPQGALSAREAISRYYADRGLQASPDDIFLTASSSESYSALFKLLANPGEAILVPEPSYPLFDSLLALEGIEKAPYHLLKSEAHWRIDREALRQAIRESPAKIKALVLVNPNNPTGSFVDEADWKAAIDIALEFNLAILCDEVFWDYPLGHATRVSGVSSNHVLTFTLSGLSKVCGLPHLKLGWIGVSGPKAEVEEAKSRLEFILDCALSVAAPITLALPALLSLNLHEMILSRVSENAAQLKKAFGGHSKLSLDIGEGGWSALLRLPDEIADDGFSESLLRNHHVLVHPGYFFDFPEGEWMVLSLLSSPVEFLQGIGRIS